MTHANQDAELTEPGVKVRIDDFCAQFSHELDRKFWLRVEKPYEPIRRITDLIFGQMTNEEASRILYIAMKTLNISLTGTYLFADVGSGSRTRAAIEIERIKNSLALCASFDHMAIRDDEISKRNGKYELLVSIF